MENVVALSKAETNQTDVLMQVNSVLESKTITASQLAKEISVSSATLSQVLKGKYAADPSAVIEKLKKWLRLRDDRLATPNINPGFVMTKTAEQIITDITFAHAVAEDGIVVIYGSPGVGKTQALKHYRANNNNVWMIFASPSRSSITAFLYGLALEMGILNPTKRKDDLSRAIISKIHRTEGIIIIDEAQHLSFETLEELRIIQEETSIPMVLSGNKKTYAKMTGGVRTEDFAQLFSRIAKKRGIHKTKQADVRAIADAWNVNGANERSLMQQISERPGGLRLLSKTLKLSAMYAQNKPITEQLLRKAFNELEANE
ncbi:AAA family ATPase [Vibrio fluvialis]|uniref:AAA family ATPase n=1 Tax=Vibrio fluvialis TaxID=676 RepID=UPI001EE9B9B2|nr:AAA family ATPase [Vibrio fluvialis]MCG6346693.1 AAA family ATPase [Vibrio fluvialis]